VLTLASLPLDDKNVMNWQNASLDRRHDGWQKVRPVHAMGAGCVGELPG
jgi:hypothetical protein